jgi:hypothetical protein
MRVRQSNLVDEDFDANLGNSRPAKGAFENFEL